MLKTITPTSPVPTASDPVSPNFDWHQLNQLAGEDPNFAIELLAIFLKDAQNSLTLLERAIAAQSTQAIEEAAHALRGASVNVGANAIAQIAQQLEQSARSGRVAQARERLQQLRDRIQTLRSETIASVQ